MTRSLSFLVVLAFSTLSSFLATDVVVLKSISTLYDKSPKLRIRGEGFTDVDDHDISIDLAGTSNLVPGKDFVISKDSDGDGLILKLLSNRK